MADPFRTPLKKQPKPLTQHRIRVIRRVAFSPDRRTLASVWSNYTIKLWDVSALIEP